jgi:hypothetical protein
MSDRLFGKDRITKFFDDLDAAKIIATKTYREACNECNTKTAAAVNAEWAKWSDELCPKHPAEKDWIGKNKDHLICDNCLNSVRWTEGGCSIEYEDLPKDCDRWNPQSYTLGEGTLKKQCPNCWQERKRSVGL